MVTPTGNNDEQGGSRNVSKTASRKTGSATTAPVTEHIELRPINTEMSESYLDYAMSVIVARALPDVRDGLKPVHRRILFVMHELGLTSGAKYRKSAAVIGDTLARYHPHGDMAVYDAMVHLAQPFAMRYPLVDGQGNWGSIDGDPAAAHRYTEARMTSLAGELLKDIEKETVPWRDNYDGTRQEPTVLPARLPTLLLNGTIGIAVGMATNIPPHNLGEVCDGIMALIDQDNVTAEDLLKIIPGPDFPTGGIMYGRQDIAQAYATGRGGIVVRGKAEIVEEDNMSKIIITEIPYQVNKATLVERIADLVKEKKVEGIKDLRDESSKDGIRVVIELKRDAYPKHILNQLYNHTQLQETFHVNALALVGGLEPKLLNLKDILTEFIAHRQVMVRRRTEYDLKKTRERLHILEGLRIALAHLDDIIKLIKKSANKEEAKTQLMKTYRMSEIQALAILAMRLGDLAKLESLEIEQEYDEKKNTADTLESILKSEKKILNIIRAEVTEMKEKYGDPRRTKIVVGRVQEFSQEDLIPDSPTLITLTKDGYIKRLPPDTFKTQARGGKGVIGLTTKEEDAVDTVLTTTTHADLYFFTTKGKVFKLKAYEIPESSRTSKGQAMVNFIEIGQSEKISATLHLSGKEVYKYLVMATKRGVMKKTEIAEFDNVRRSGLIAISLKDDDELLFVKPSDGASDIFLTSAQGQAIRSPESGVRGMGRTAAGVHGIRLKTNDYVVAMNIISKRDLDPELDALVLMANGYGKRTKMSQYKKQHRGGVGIKGAKVTPKTGSICQAKTINLSHQKEDAEGDLLIISKMGQVIRLPLSDIPRLGRATQGVRVMRFKEANDSIASATVI